MRYIFIDTIENIDETSIEGSKFLCLNEDIFKDHFPNYPILPAALMVESAIQLGRLFMWNSSNFRFTLLPTSFDKFKFLDILTPGNILRISLVINKGEKSEYNLGETIRIKTTGYSNDKKCFEGVITFNIMSFEKLHNEKKVREYFDFLMSNYKKNKNAV
ncbi:hypothetical protein KPL35_16105 [Clostridium sp. CF011]|uniref:3-hydroxyacyl-ACP dehydratase FabZ family protein n=1 Tax=Clostridium sp. CF011 TaxID=2843318 RepID=UPI001C0D4BCA|nr:hypothetical protein [Clostridium sp. CF011]MBU3093583.1 hypothetical protein [Clostridium sp. CF011]WAG71694.1 hypothetical protein LL036_18540 [Clostridium sp. CF011]